MKKHIYYLKGTVCGTERHSTDWEDTLDGSQLVSYLDDIKNLFLDDPQDELSQYINEESILKNVITLIKVEPKIIGTELFSITTVEANKELDDAEKEELRNYITGQFSDGFGEGLEQNPFLEYKDYYEEEEYDYHEDDYYMAEVEDNVEMLFHLWQFKEFKLEFITEEELNGPKGDYKPRCKLIGQDGNIFSLMGIASRCLVQNNKADKAEEMLKRVTSSGSYEEALSVIGEYVEIY